LVELLRRKSFRVQGLLLSVCLFVSGCTSLAGLDKDYELVPSAGGTGGAAGGTGGAGDGGVSGSGGASGSTGATGSGGTIGSGGTAAVSGTSGAGGSGGTSTSGGAGGSTAGEDCANTVDDDGDQLADCLDTDCRDVTSCQGKCAQAAVLDCNTPRTSQSTNAAGNTQRIAPPDYECAPGQRPGPEYAYRVLADVGQSVFVSLYGLSADLGIFAVEVAQGAQCDAVQACVAHGDGLASSEPEALSFPRLSGADYFVVVDGPSSGDYSIITQCSSRSICQPVRAIQAGQSITATNAAGSAPNVTDAMDVYTCLSNAHSSPEVAYMFTPTEPGTYNVELTGLTGNLDLFVVTAPDCDTRCLSPSSRSGNASTQPESVQLTAEAHTSYYIVVDGYVTSSFTLSVTKL
jgi:hypothetical protein